jgi:hypothetical protein
MIQKPSLFVLALFFLKTSVINCSLETNQNYEHQTKEGRIFSNPFGILGNDVCDTELNGNNVTGICYNEIDCLLG